MTSKIWNNGLNRMNKPSRLHTTQPTSSGAVTADTSCCANCVEPSRPHQWWPDLPFLGMPAMALLLTKAGDVETNPGPTTLNKRVWICDICHKQIHVRKQISQRCNRIEHWVHLRCAGIRQALSSTHHPHRPELNTYTCHTLHQHLSLHSSQAVVRKDVRHAQFAHSFENRRIKCS